MKARLKSVDEHLKEKSKDPRFRAMVELEKEKAKISSLIIEYRVDHRLNQGQLAKKIGVTQQYISKIEDGDFSSLVMVGRILQALGYRVSLRALPLESKVKRLLQKAA